MTARAARNEPVSLVLSGPAGGVIGAVAFSKLVDQPNLITIDMGGTSLDASLVLDHEPVLYQGAEFEGMPINMPSLYIHTIGAGGGSIAWLDGARALQVGPQSAGASQARRRTVGAETQPTFTDAAVVLGYLGSDTSLGGTLTLDAALAEQALAPMAESLGMTISALARGIVSVRHQDHGRGSGNHGRSGSRSEGLRVAITGRRRRPRRRGRGSGVGHPHRHRSAGSGRILRLRKSDGGCAARFREDKCHAAG